jgi:phage terminase small subunit|nr:MAG TPA: Terminase small subunit [Caudoviricetes sp.]
MNKPQYELAEEDYINGMKYKEIAEKYGVSINTVKSWKTRYNWCKDKKSTHTKGKKVCTQNKKSAGAKKNNECDIKEPIADEVKEVLENTELNEKQRLFCVIYAKCLNATKAYQKVYKCTYETAMVNGCKLLRNTKIKEQLNKLIESDLNYEFLQKSIAQKYKDIAFADINDYMEYGTEYEPQFDKEGNVKLDENGEIITKPKSYVLLNNSVKTDGTVISEISAGNNGVKIKLVDKMKAMAELRKIKNLLDEKEKLQLDIENKRLQSEKLQADIVKVKAETARIASKGNGNDSDGELENMLRGIKDGL